MRILFGKQTIALLLLLVAAMALSGCAAATQAVSSPVPSPAASASAAAPGFSADDLVFKLDGQAFELKKDIAPLLKKLGDGYKLTQAPSCLYKGYDKTFEYPGISIYTFPTNDVDYIDEIDLTGSAYSTPKGVKVGGTMADITAAYGSGYFDDGGVIVYSTGKDPSDKKSPRLYFTLEGGKITLIGFYSASNVQ